MKVVLWCAALTLVLISIAALIYSRWETTEEQPVLVELPLPPASDAPRYPLPRPKPEPESEPATPIKPLPALDESDVPLQTSLDEIFGEESVWEILKPQNIIRNVVVTIDNLPREKLAEQFRPVNSVKGVFRISGTDAAIALSPENYARYQPFIELLRVADAEQVARLYFRFYPLFQQAYVDLGYPSRNFNDRVVEVIDHLLLTPAVQSPIKLVQPKVYYQFADPELEAMSAGQKILIRIGSENAAVVKTKLKEIRAVLVPQE